MGLASVHIIGGDTIAKTTGYAEALAVSTASSKLFALRAFNKGADCYLQMFNRATAPVSTTTVPDMCLKLIGDLYTGEEFNDGMLFTTGIYVAASSTADVFTTLGSNDILMQASYRLFP